MASIFKLVGDLNELLGSELSKEQLGSAFADDRCLSRLVLDKLTRGDTKPTYRMSNHGWPDRKLWYYINRPETREQLRPEVKLKFLYGDLIEALILPLAEASGHKVEGRQDERTINGLKGHIDCIIDGMLIDIKSANSRAFDRWRDGSFVTRDPFGYLDQLHLYLSASQEDERVTYKREAGWLVVDKELGHVILRTLTFQDRDFVAEINQKREMLSAKEPPARCFPDKSEGASGNRKLDVQCSYCPYKEECWPG